MNVYTAVTAAGQGLVPVQTLELLVNGQAVGMFKRPDGQGGNTINARWDWLPAREGSHTLLVRAADANGNISTSDSVTVTVSARANITGGRHYQAQKGDSFDSVLQRFGIATEQLAEFNPALDLTAPLREGEVINLPAVLDPVTSSMASLAENSGLHSSGPVPAATPIPDVKGSTLPLLPKDGIPVSSPLPAEAGLTELPPFDPSRTSQVMDLPLSGLSMWVNINIRDRFSLPSDFAPKPPAVIGSVEACNAVLKIQSIGATTAFYVYRKEPFSTKFARIATLSPVPASATRLYSDTGLWGEYQYYVSSLSGGKELAGKVITLNINNPACQTDTNRGVVISKATLSTSSVVDGVFLYLQVNDTGWMRKPESPVSYYVTGSGGNYDFTPYLPGLAIAPKIKLDMRCYGYQGGALLKLGSDATYTLDATKLPSSVVLKGDACTLTLQISKGSPPAPPVNTTLTPPYSLRSTNSVSECSSHLPTTAGFASLACELAIQSNDAVLVWEWSPACKAGSTCVFDDMIAGYKLYRARPGAKFTLVSTKPIDYKSDRFAPPSGLFLADGPDSCYVVRSYNSKGAESANSNVFCMSHLVSGLAHAELTPSGTDYLWARHYSALTGGLCGMDKSGIGVEDFAIAGDETVAGWDHSYSGVICWRQLNFYYRGLARFDLSSLPGTPKNAILNYDVTRGDCLDSLNLAKNPADISKFDRVAIWGTKEGSGSISMPGPAMDAIKSAGQKATFVLTGKNENLGEENNDYCVARISGLLLSVDYLKK
jgi:hypothetical protein